MPTTQVQADFDVDTPIDHNFHPQPSVRMKRWESTLPDEYWDYRERWQQQPRNHLVGAFPIHLDIEATSACNMRCIMCPRTEMVERGAFWKVQAFDFERYKHLVDEGVRYGLCSIKYNYLGEPTLNKRLIEMIRYAKQAGVIDVMFNTNASRTFTEDLSRQLVDSGLDKLFFSFDSPFRETYNRIRQGGDYDQTLDNIRRFMRIREQLGRIKPFTRVSMVLMRETRDHWPAFKALFEPIVDAVAYVDYLDHSSQQQSTRQVAGSARRPGKFCCPQLWQRAFVHPDGVVTACCIDSARELVMGNVFDRPMNEIWTDEPYQRLRRLHQSGRIGEVPTCARCPLAQI